MIITTATQLQNMNLSLTSDYELGNDIDCSGIANFEPVGLWGGTDVFTGSFDGKGYTISNLTVNRAADDFIGLFGRTDGCSFMGNVTLEDFTLTGDDYIGAFCGDSRNHSISNVSVINVTIVGDDICGGMAGILQSGTVGQTLTNCNSTGTITAGWYVGGLVGYHNILATSNCHSSVNITADGWEVGGLVGRLSTGAYEKCYATGTVTGDDYVGGFVGHLFASVGTETINRCYATGVVTSTDDNAGGFVGFQTDGEINDCYSLGTVEGDDYIGGFAGVGDTINRCYSTGSITHGGGRTNVGGFMGGRGGGVETANCFWDTTTSGEATGVGGGEPQGGVTGHITATMKMLSTFSEAGWSIPSIWNISAGCVTGYPCLVGVNPCCGTSALPPLDPTVAPKRVSLELIRNLEMMNLGRAYVDKSGNFTYESRYAR